MADSGGESGMRSLPVPVLPRPAHSLALQLQFLEDIADLPQQLLVLDVHVPQAADTGGIGSLPAVKLVEGVNQSST